MSKNEVVVWVLFSAPFDPPHKVGLEGSRGLLWPGSRLCAPAKGAPFTARQDIAPEGGVVKKS